MNFEAVWRDAFVRPGGMVQEYHELEHVFNIFREHKIKTYLEVGTAEGKSLLVLAQSNPNMDITYIDLGETHTEAKRAMNISALPNNITSVLGNSNSWGCYEKVKDKRFDAVLIDAGHDLFSVLVDACFYGPLATKYVFFHDITIPDVEKVFNWYCKFMPNKKHYRVVNSKQYGFGVIEV